MSETIETYIHAGLTIEIETDEDCSNPRENDNAGKLFIAEGNNYIGVNELGKVFDSFEHTDWDGVDAEVLAAFPKAEILPVYRYEHGGVAYNTTGFSCPWDSGRVGLVLCTYETMLHEWGKKIVTRKVREQARACMVSELEEYGSWANGDCYGYTVLDPDGEELDSCWGFIGDIDYVKSQAEASADAEAPRLPSKEAKEATREHYAAEHAGQLRMMG